MGAEKRSRMSLRDEVRGGRTRGRAGRALAAWGIALAVVAGGACSNTPPSMPPPEPPVAEPYVIGVTDQLLISVWKNPELGASVVVRSDGKVSIPLLDDVQAAGLTPEELKEVVTERLAEFITAPHVTVMVQQMNSRTVSLMGAGAVRQGLVPLGRRMRVLDAIVAMGGFSVWAKKNRVTVLRETPAGREEYRFNYEAYVDGKAPGTNLLLQPGDTIIVPD